MKVIGIFVFFIIGLFSFSQSVLAHVMVKPDTVGIGMFQTFTTSVPNEKDNPVVTVRLIIPQELHHVSPSVKSGWNIEVKKKEEGENAKVTEILWTGGSIPAGQRDDFTFSAQVPTIETTLLWKAYQTYKDGSIVSWDEEGNPNMTNEDEGREKQNKGPASQTKVIDDLSNTKSKERNSLAPLFVSVAALLLSIVSLSWQLLKK